MTNASSILYRKNYFGSIWFSLESQHENRYIGDILILFLIVVDDFHFPVVQIKRSIGAWPQLYGD